LSVHDINKANQKLGYASLYRPIHSIENLNLNLFLHELIDCNHLLYRFPGKRVANKKYSQQGQPKTSKCLILLLTHT
jgi:hypothetical protein